jgi:chromate reductase
MAAQRNVAVLVGSLRRASITRRVARAMEALAPEGLRLAQVPIGDLALYNEDLEASPPEAWRVFRDTVRPVDAVIFATPEYNRSVPGLLKNAIDVGSRPYGQSVWSSKPAAVVSVSPGAIGGYGANHHLRQSLVFLDMPALQQPEAYIGQAASLFTETGEITSEGTGDFLSRLLVTFAAWIEKTAPR